MANSLKILGQIIHFESPTNLQVIPKGFVIINSNGKIASLGDEKHLEKTLKSLDFTPETTIVLSKTQLLLPGLIDTHIHAPQYPNAGLGYDKELLDWLNCYTYKLEKQYKDDNLSNLVYNAIVRKTIAYGTTTACYFGSLYRNSTLILTKAIETHGQRALVGKVNMITLAPDDYVETREQSIQETLLFVNEIIALNNPLIKAVITPRFALSMDMEHMTKLAEIAREYNLHIQTHISENTTEVKLVNDTYKDSYANVYNSAQLLSQKTVLAHGIYLNDDELELLRKTGTSISHCPDSNTILCSGLCDVRKLQKFGLNIGLGTDIAGGASASIIQQMRAAIGVSTHISFNKENYSPLNYKEVFYLATLGGAKALSLDDEIGNFQVGKSFDAIIVDLDVAHSSADYLLETTTSLELLQKFVFLGDDRNVINVFVNGKSVKKVEF